MSKVMEALWKTLIPRSPAFTTTDVATAAGVSLDQASRDLGRLAVRKLIVRVIPGVWAVVTDPRFSPYAVVTPLIRIAAPKAKGYVSLLSALNLHGMIEQIPRAIQVIASRRMRSPRRTPVGAYQFYVMSPMLVDGYGRYESGAFDIATPEKAVFDVLYLSVRKGTRFSHLPEFTLPRNFSPGKLRGWIRKISYPPLRGAVAAKWATLRGTLELPQRVAG